MERNATSHPEASGKLFEISAPDGRANHHEFLMTVSTSKHLTLFICGDFHAYDGGLVKKNPPSWFDVRKFGDPASCPIAQLITFVKREPILADVAVNCGDLGDKANPAATTTAWKAFQELADALKAAVRIATAGNHDVDSRFATDYDAKGCMQSLDPLFPFADDAKFDQYWSRHFFILQTPDYRIVSLNSSAYHGYKDEYEHGRVSPRTLTRLTAAIAAGGPSPVNILICHHPPQHQAERGQGETDNMEGGADLIEALAADPQNPWLIVHGHKHYPKLQYARGTGDAPVILSAGSISAIPYALYGKDAKNQVHLICIDLEESKKSGMKGVVKTYDWTTAGKWRYSSRDGGLPAQCGFGNRATSMQNAQVVAAAVAGRCTWSDVLVRCPDIQFIPGNTLDNVFSLLETQFSIVTSFDRSGQPIELTRK
jgi:predicted MPP superfamily phosphohydrolase